MSHPHFRSFNQDHPQHALAVLKEAMGRSISCERLCPVGISVAHRCGVRSRMDVVVSSFIVHQDLTGTAFFVTSSTHLINFNCAV
jgi:hypothetical protein